LDDKRKPRTRSAVGSTRLCPSKMLADPRQNETRRPLGLPGEGPGQNVLWHWSWPAYPSTREKSGITISLGP